MELCLALNNLRAVLFNHQPLLSAQSSEPFCAALIPILHCVCFGLDVCESYLPSIVILNDVYIGYLVAQSFRPAQER
jgi:hypothetical protein